MIVISVNQMNLSTGLSFAYNNGAIEFRDRASMRLIEADENYARVSSLQQVGFSFPSDEMCKGSALVLRDCSRRSTELKAGLYAATSPNSCLAVALASDGKLRLKAMLPRAGSLGTSTDDREFCQNSSNSRYLLTYNSIVCSYRRCVCPAIRLFLHQPQQQ